jgi:uncharacterized membrane protein YfcA
MQAARMISDPIFYLVAIPAVIFVGFSKGGFGGALGGTAVPLMAIAISPTQAASILLPILCLADLFGLRMYFGKWHAASLKVLIPGAVAGVALGALTFGLLNEDAIRLLIGIISVLFVAAKWMMSSHAQSPEKPSLLKGSLLSTTSGYTSFVAHAGGPPIMMYLLPQRLDKTAYIATTNIFFLLTNAIKLAPYAWLGQFSSANLIASATLAPLVPLGVWCGYWLQEKVSQKLFYNIAQACLLLTGLQLIYQSASKFIS